MTSYADCEPLLSDDRLLRAQEAVMREYGLPDGTQFATALVPTLSGDQCHFIIVTPNPRHYEGSGQNTLQSTGWTTLRGWEESEKERGHFVTYKPDPALVFFRLLGKQMAVKVQDLREII